MQSWQDAGLPAGEAPALHVIQLMGTGRVLDRLLPQCPAKIEVSGRSSGKPALVTACRSL